MAGVSMTERIAVLKAKKDAKTITTAERLELQELTLKQRMAKLAKARANLSDQKRKAENALKYKLGGLVVKAGLGEWDEAALLGALVSISNTATMEKVFEWRAAGGRIFNADAETKAGVVAMVVKFATAPSETITTMLGSKGFAWDREKQVWEGRGVLHEIAAVVGPAGGTVIDAAAAPALAAADGDGEWK